MREERQRERDVLFWISITTYEIPITLRLTHQRKSEGWFMRSFCVVFVYVWSATSLCRSWHTNQPACHNHNSFCNRKLQIFLMQYWWRKYKKWKLCMYRSIECLNNSEFVFYVFFLQLPIIQTNVYIVLYVVKRPNVAVV